MSIIDDHGRPEPPIAADETATLLGFRATMAWKTRGLDSAGLQVKVAASSRILLSMTIRHPAAIWANWFAKS